MNFDDKKIIMNKARHAYGLYNVLKYNIDILRQSVKDKDYYKLHESLHDTKLVLHKLMLNIEEIEYILNLDKYEGP